LPDQDLIMAADGDCRRSARGFGDAARGSRFARIGVAFGSRGGGVFRAIIAIVIIFESTMSVEGPKPKAGLTPGETRRRVFSEYGINRRAGQVDLATAQHAIAAHWIGAYKKYLGASLPR
jgi:hypothetical protein